MLDYDERTALLLKNMNPNLNMLPLEKTHVWEVIESNVCGYFCDMDNAVHRIPYEGLEFLLAPELRVVRIESNRDLTEDERLCLVSEYMNELWDDAYNQAVPVIPRRQAETRRLQDKQELLREAFLILVGKPVSHCQLQLFEYVPRQPPHDKGNLEHAWEFDITLKPAVGNH